MLALAYLRLLRLLRWALAGWYPADAVRDLDAEIDRREGERDRHGRGRGWAR